MLSAVVLCVAVAVTTAQIPSFGGCPNAKTQDTFDIDRYMGRWHEIYRFSTSFENGQHCNRANYTHLANGHIKVFNDGYSQSDGKYVSASGDAYRPDDSKPAQLAVRFAPNTPYGKYWVLDTDYDTYTLIYSCEQVLGLAHFEFGWILARQPTIDDLVKDKLFNTLKSFNIDASKFQKTDQTNCKF